MTEHSVYDHCLSRLQSGDYPSASCADETAWYDAWMSRKVGVDDSLATALVGGALADRLAWVFHAGYQGMMRYAFPFCPRDGWASYLVAEDKTGEYPGTVLTTADGEMTLSGFKSWVAASEHVDHLVVRVSGSDADTLVVVARDASGVKLSSRAKPGFLADLSQGFAAFDNVDVGDTQVFSAHQLPSNFAQSEPHHVLTALNAFMVSHTSEAESEVCRRAAVSLRLSGDLADCVGDEFIVGLADLDAQTSETASEFETTLEQGDPELFDRWRADRGLVRMFSRGLQKRADRIRDK